MRAPHFRLAAADKYAPAIVVPRRNSMPPPQLAAHAPVLDVPHPLEVGLGPVLRHEARASHLDLGDGGPGERCDFDVPLIGEIRLEHRAAAIAARNHEPVFLDPLDEAGALQLRDDDGARIEAVKAAEAMRHVVIEGRARREDVELGKSVPKANLIVVEIVRRCDFDAAGTEFRIDVGIGNDADRAPGKRQQECLADEVSVAQVVGIYRNGGISQHRLRPRRGNRDVPGAILERVAQMPQMPLFLLALHFQIRQSGEQHRVPVDEALATVDEAFLVQPHKCLGDRARQLRIHREALARPVDRHAEPAHLRTDRAAGALLPGPDARHECLASKFTAPKARRLQLPFNHHLGRNPGVIGAGLPQRVGAAHALVARERVHERVLKGMPHVQRAGHVRRRNHDAVAACSRPRGKIPGRLPTLIQTLFDSGGRVDFFHPGMRLGLKPSDYRA